MTSICRIAGKPLPANLVLRVRISAPPSIAKPRPQAGVLLYVDTVSIFYLEPKGTDPGQRRIHPLLRFAVLNRDDFLCRYCGGPATEVDHTTPWSRGGETLPFNLAAACRACNRAKGERTPEEWHRDLAAERARKAKEIARAGRPWAGRPERRSRRRFSRSRRSR